MGIRSAGMLESSAYLASVAATLRLQNATLANSCCPNPDPAVGEALIIWKTQSHTVEPASPADQYQKAWNNIVASSAVDNLASLCNNKIDKARLKAAVAPHFGDWLNAIPISSVGLRLSDVAIRVAMGHLLARPPAILTHASVEVKSTPGVYIVWLARRVCQDTSTIRC